MFLQKNSSRKIFGLVFLVLVLRLVLAPLIWHPDINNHIDWGIRFWEYGPSRFYAANVWSFTWPNQPPGTIYLFAFIRKLFEFIFGVLWTINVKIPLFPSGVVTWAEGYLYLALLKLPAILADVGIGLLIYRLLKLWQPKTKAAVWGLVIWLFNPVIWYNSAVWGQSDAVINFFLLLAVFWLLKKKLIWAVLAFGLCLYIKASLLVFAPLLLVLAIKQEYGWKKWLIAFAVTLLVIGLLTLPFSQGEPFSWLFLLFREKVFGHQLQIITANAFNLWAAITGISEKPQTLPFLGLTFQAWGLILFTLAYLPLLKLVFKKQNLRTVVWSLALVAFSAFLLLTNMHERYLFPLFPYLTILAAVNSRLRIGYWAVSLINLANLYNFWWQPQIPILAEILSARERLLPRILGGVAVLLYIFFYKQFLNRGLEIKANASKH